MPLIEITDLCVYRAPRNMAPPVEQPGIVFYDASPETIERFFANDHRRRETFLGFLKAGFIGWFQCQGEEWITHAWVAPPGANPPHLPAWTKKAGVYWGFFGHTNEPYRGSGYFTRALRYGVWSIQQQSSDTDLYVDSKSTNEPSRYAMLAVGMQPQGLIKHITLKFGGFAMVLSTGWHKNQPHPQIKLMEEKNQKTGDPNKFRLVFFGTSSHFSLTILEHLAARYNFVGVVESAPRGKPSRPLFQKKSQTQLKTFASTRNLPYLLLSKGNKLELQAFLQSLKPDLGCIASFSQLIPQEAIEIPKHGILNLHPALLPKFRGPNPWLWVYLEKEFQTGVTIHWIDRGEDTGDILVQQAFDVPLGMPLEEMQEKAFEIGKTLYDQAIKQIQTGTTHPFIQREIVTSPRARIVHPGEHLIDWEDWDVEHIYHALRGGQKWLTADLPKLPSFLKWHIAGYTNKIVSKMKAGSLRWNIKGFRIICKNGEIILCIVTNNYEIKRLLLGS